jgi:hypothetical protein
MEAGLMTKMTICLNTYRAVTTHNNYVFMMKKTDSDFKKNYPEYVAIIKNIDEIRKKINGN